MAQNIVHETGYYSTGRISANYRARVTNPTQGPPFQQAVRAVRAQLPQQPMGAGAFRGRTSSNPGAPVRNPVRGPVFVAKPAPVRYVLPPWQPRAGRIGSSAGAAVQNPSAGPPVYAPLGPARARLPQLRPRAGRVSSNPGAPVRNPSAGPVFTQKTWPVQARDPLPRHGRTYVIVKPVVVPPPAGPPFTPALQALRARLPQQPLLRGRVASSPGAPVANPVRGPVFRQAASPARTRPALPPRGRITSSPAAPAAAPAPSTTGPIFYPRNTARAALLLPRRGICRAIRFYPLPANPSPGPAFRQASSPSRTRPVLPPRGRITSTPAATVQIPVPPVTGPVFYPKNWPARARIPQNAPRGRAYSNPGAPIRNPQPGPVFRREGLALRARLPFPPPKGRTASSPGGPVVPVPNVVQVTGSMPGAIRAALPVVMRGRVTSNPGAPVVPASAPGLSMGQPAGVRVIYLVTGRTQSNRIQAVPRNPSAGPVFRQATQPARIRITLPPRGRVASNPGGPVQNPVFVVGPPFFPFRSPARARIPQNAPRGRVYGNPGAPVRNPAAGPQFRQAVQPIRARQPLPARGRVWSNPGTPPPLLTIPAPLHPQGTIRARLPLQPFLKGRVSSNPGVFFPHPGPVFRQATQPVRARQPLPPRGRTASNAGAPVRNPVPGPAFIQKPWPARARIPQNAPRGRTASNPGGPVANVPINRILITTGDPFTLWETSSPLTVWDTGDPVTAWETGSPFTIE